jgi:voltage-gated potassium channel
MNEMKSIRANWRSVGKALLPRLEVVVILAALLSVPLTIVEVNGQNGASFQGADWVIWSAFAIEYALALALAEDRRRFVVSAWLSVLVVVVSFPLLPALFGIVRLARLARLLRLVRLVAFGARLVTALKATVGRRGFLYVAALFILLVVMAGAIMSLVEPQTVKGNMWDGIWWAVVTATTVGYGDISPVSPAGRLVAVALMLFGIGLTATLAASVAAYFVNQDSGSDLAEVVARLERMERLLLDQKAVRDAVLSSDSLANVIGDAEGKIAEV